MAAHARKWPRRAAIAAVVTGALLAGAYWYGGRESTLQLLAQKVATASGGSLVIDGVSGSLYGAMHIKHLVFKSPEQIITGDDIDIDWSPWQYLSHGIEVSKLRVASLVMQSLKESEPPKMPVSLAPPFRLAIADAQVARLVMISPGAKAGTQIDRIVFKLLGDDRRWELRGASAATPWGLATADGSIGATKPFKLDANATLAQSNGPARLKLHAGGDLLATDIAASGASGKASGEARFALAPFDPVPLRAMTINGRGIDPDIFNPALPKADLSIALSAKIEANRKVSGSLAIDNAGPEGSIDKERLPLKAIRGQLSGDLAALHITGLLIDLGAAGQFTGEGSVARADTAASFKLHTGRIDLKALHSKLKATKIAGDIVIANAGKTQTLDAHLADGKLRLDARAKLADNAVTIEEALIAAGSSRIAVTGNASLKDTQVFKVKASASHFNPASFGDYPTADINADINADGHVAPKWQVAANFALRPSRLFDQPLSGKGKLAADAAHVSGVDATLALGSNTVDLRGTFGAPGEKLNWRLDGRQLSALRKDLYGAVSANGVVTGTMDAPRTSFELDARGLGWNPKARANNTSVVHASGEASLAGVKASGHAEHFDPQAFGAPIAGSINGTFDASASKTAGAINLVLQPSTLSNAPFFGYAKLAGDKAHISSADVDLHVGPNLIAAKGSFGKGSDVLEWRLDAPQLAALGPDFAGVLRGSGTLTGTIDAPAVKGALEGQSLKLLGKHQIKTLRATASLGGEALAADIDIGNYASGDTRVLNAHLQANGTRAAHTLKLSARGENFDAQGEAQGGFSGPAWTGAINSLQNKGTYAFVLRAPAPLRVSSLSKPQQIAFGPAIVTLPEGAINLQSVTKNGSHWSSKGAAAGIPLNYIAQFSKGMRDNVAGDLTLGGQWNLDLQTALATGAAPVLVGNVHVYREKGDLIVGSEVPVVLGLRTLDLATDLTDGAMRTQLVVDGERAGQVRIDATTRMVDGLLGNDSPLKLTASADMPSIAWLAPLSGLPGLELDGTLKANLQGAGAVGAPTLNGTVVGDKLAVRWTDQGVKLRNGQLRAQLTGDQLVLQRLSFEGTQGTAVADGAIRFSGGEATMQLKLVADKLEALSRPDRTLVVSGQSTLTRDARHFTLEGKFRADRALIELAPQGRPTLSDDVIVLGRTSTSTAAREAQAMPLTVDLEADLGDAFHLRGMGIDAELAGTVHLRQSGGRAPRVNGGIRVVSGNYAAYGQKLTIERGVLTFSGPYDNPALNIRAVRKRPEGDALTETNVEAGVEVRGTALAPVAKLVSTPTVPDSDKLAWLVLGHGMDATSGNEAGVLSAAASALLSGKGGGGTGRLASSLGVDELGLSQAKGLESTVVTVGKRISSRAYLSFEQGATTASSLVKLRYKLNPRITLQFQTGTNSALDVLYSWAFD